MPMSYKRLITDHDGLERLQTFSEKRLQEFKEYLRDAVEFAEGFPFPAARFILTVRGRLNDKEDKNAIDRTVRGILSKKHIPSLEKRFPIYRIDFENMGEFAARFSQIDIRCFSLEDAKEIARISFGDCGVITISSSGKDICKRKGAGEWTQL